MQLFVILSLFILVLVFHVEFDTLKKFLLCHLEELFEEYKRESSSRSVEEFHNV